MMNIERTPDLLDELATLEAQTDPRALQDWEAMKLVAQLIKARNANGLSQTDVAGRMGVPQQRVAEIERRPWSVSFGRVLVYARAVGAPLTVDFTERLVA